LSVAHDALPGHASRDPQSDAKYPSDGFRSHSDYDGSSGGPYRAPAHPTDWQLPTGRCGSNVSKFNCRSLRHSPRWPLLPEEPVTSRLRELIQQLGEAIHESVIESEQIAGVVQDIRRHGFDVLLMLEATIGLNEVSKDAENAEGAEVGDEGATFTKNDVNFLRSLRISIEGEDENEAREG
jgi:hypothetical protein